MTKVIRPEADIITNFVITTKRLKVMKNLIIAFATLLSSNYAAAQLDPKTSQGNTSDTILIPKQPTDKTKIANKGILRRNSMEVGGGKPDPVKKDIKTNEPVPIPNPPAKSRVEAVADTITKKK